MIIKSALGVVASLALGATPALAQENLVSQQTSAQFAGVIETSTISQDVAQIGDEEFSELFASWEALDNGGRVTRTGLVAPAPQASVAVPSRMPLDILHLTSSYGMRDHPILRQRRQHHGVDLAAPRGTPVYATADGRVGQAERFGSYGNYVRIEHGGDLHTRYAHLSSYTVSEGDVVQKGDLIGYVGSTGRSTGPHLHYEVRIGDESVNPLPYMTAGYASLNQEEGAIGGPE